MLKNNKKILYSLVAKESNISDTLFERHSEIRQLVDVQSNPFRLRFFKTLTMPLNERISHQKEVLLDAMLQMSRNGIKIGIRPLCKVLNMNNTTFYKTRNKELRSFIKLQMSKLNT